MLTDWKVYFIKRLTLSSILQLVVKQHTEHLTEHTCQHTSFKICDMKSISFVTSNLKLC